MMPEVVAGLQRETVVAVVVAVLLLAEKGKWRSWWVLFWVFFLDSLG